MVRGGKSQDTTKHRSERALVGALSRKVRMTYFRSYVLVARGTDEGKADQKDIGLGV